MNIPNRSYVVGEDGTVTFVSLFGSVSQVNVPSNKTDPWQLADAQREINRMNEVMYRSKPRVQRV